MSLSALAAKANLAKSTLSQLESGKGNPNVETLWAIAVALDIPFSSLFEGASSRSQLVRAGEGVGLASGQSEFSTVLLDKCPPDRRRDIYRIRLLPGAVRRADPHPQGTLEHALVCHGKVSVGPLDELVDLGPGDYFRYPGDVAHSYEAVGEEALLVLIMDSLR